LNLAMKQRLVGTIVLGSLALIGIPLLLDGEGVETPPLSLVIPPPPRITTTPIPEPVRPAFAVEEIPVQMPIPEPVVAAETLAADTPGAAAAGTETAEPTATLAETTPEVPAVETTPTPPARSDTVPARDVEGLPEAWTVRLGAFAARANAEALVARLLTAGHKAYLQPVTTGQGSMSGVFVGPVLTRTDAEQLRQQLAAGGFGEEGLVQQFRIAP